MWPNVRRLGMRLEPEICSQAGLVVKPTGIEVAQMYAPIVRVERRDRSLELSMNTVNM